MAFKIFCLMYACDPIRLCLCLSRPSYVKRVAIDQESPKLRPLGEKSADEKQAKRVKISKVGVVTSKKGTQNATSPPFWCILAIVTTGSQFNIHIRVRLINPGIHAQPPR